MISLNKSNQQAIDYVSNFISGQWLENNDGSYEYRNIGYDNINKTIYRAFCLAEQKNVCCYCNREIDNSPQTELEHIIPRSVETEEELQLYFMYSNILSENVTLQDDFRRLALKATPPPFPHHIAYQNIVASCNGKTYDTSEEYTCCNRNRGNDFVPPINLMNNCIAYENDGTIVYLPEIQNRIYLNTLNLNKQKLKDIRRLWFLFSKSNVSIQELINANNEDDYSELITLYIIANPLKSISDNRIADTFQTDFEWSVFIKYSYFLNYFRLNNN